METANEGMPCKWLGWLLRRRERGRDLVAWRRTSRLCAARSPDGCGAGVRLRSGCRGALRGFVPSSQHYGDTWEYDRGRWSFRTQFALGAVGPVNGAYDGGAGAVFVTIAGSGTWAWDGAVWSHRSSQDLRTSFGAGLAYDERRGVLVQHGGWPTYPNPNWSETWEWNGQAWRLVSDDGPSNQFYTAMVYDSRRGVCVALEGGTATWEWDGVQWRTVSMAGPPRGLRERARELQRGPRGPEGGTRGPRSGPRGRTCGAREPGDGPRGAAAGTGNFGRPSVSYKRVLRESTPGAPRQAQRLATVPLPAAP